MAIRTLRERAKALRHSVDALRVLAGRFIRRARRDDVAAQLIRRTAQRRASRERLGRATKGVDGSLHECDLDTALGAGNVDSVFCERALRNERLRSRPI